MSTTSVLYSEYVQFAATANVRALAKSSFNSKAKIIAAIDAIKATMRTRSRLSDDTVVALADIAREIGMNPKVARAKCRDDNAMRDMRKGDAWVFNRDDHDRVIEFLTA